MKKIIAIVSSILAGLGLIYLLGVGFYSDKFVAKSTYQAVNISHLTQDQALKRIEKELNEREITLQEDGKVVKTFKLKDVKPKYNLADTVEALFYNQDPSVWFLAFIDDYIYAEENKNNEIMLELDDLVEELNDNGDRVASTEAEIMYDEQKGYYVEPSKTGTIIGTKSLNDAIVQGLAEEDVVVDLEETYEPATIETDDEEVQLMMEQIKTMTQREVVLELQDEEIIISPQQLESWLMYDQNNNITYDSEGIREFLNDVNDEYGTYNKTRLFESTMQGTVEVPPGIMGWGIDVEEEIVQLTEALQQPGDIRREPITSSLGGIPGAVDDVGDSYIEIDLSYQMMFLYIDGELITQTNIVSGQIEAPTNPGANAVIEMLADTKLVGYNQFLKVDYEVPVSYWMRFDYDAQGIHDAPWQSWFGGDTFVYSGSLGCINTPIDAMETFYNYAYYGMPVMVFH